MQTAAVQTLPSPPYCSSSGTYGWAVVPCPAGEQREGYPQEMILKQEKQSSLLQRPEQCRHEPLCSARDQFWGLCITPAAGQSESAVLGAVTAAPCHEGVFSTHDFSLTPCS